MRTRTAEYHLHSSQTILTCGFDHSFSKEDCSQSHQVNQFMPRSLPEVAETMGQAASMTELLGSRCGLCLHVVSVVPGPVKYLLWDSRQSCRRGFHVLTWL